MPHIQGESLCEPTDDEGQLAVDETVEIAKGVAAALRYAHDHGIVHQDIRPEYMPLQSGQPLSGADRRQERVTTMRSYWSQGRDAQRAGR